MNEKERFIELINTWEFSNHIDGPAKEALGNCAKLVRYGKGEMIIKKDLPGRIFWIINKGKASARTVDGEGKDVVIHTMVPGDFFGEIALISTRPRTVDVVADEEIELYLIGEDDFDKYLISNARVAEALKEFAHKRLEISERIEKGGEHHGLMDKMKGLFARKKHEA